MSEVKDEASGFGDFLGDVAAILSVSRMKDTFHSAPLRS